MSEELLDEVIGSPRTAAATLSPEHVYANSGHRLLCPTCKSFQRTKIEFVEGPMLRVMCKVCGTYEDFVIDRESGFVPKWFVESRRTFAFLRVTELIGSGGKKDAD